VATNFERVLQAAGQIAGQHAQARPEVREEEQARVLGEGPSQTDAVKRRRGLIELALFHEGLGEDGGQVHRLASGRPPRLGGSERLAPLGLGLGQVAPQDKGLRAKHLNDREGEDRSAPACLGEGLVVDRQRLVEIRHRQDHAGREEGYGGKLRSDQRSTGERAARKRDGHSGGRARPRVVIGEQRYQRLLANGRVPRVVADAIEPLQGPGVEAPYVDRVGDEPRLEEALELGVGAGELIQCPGEGGVRLLVAKEEEKLAAKQELGLGSPHGVDDQRKRFP
jgi:hypothetical protein